MTDTRILRLLRPVVIFTVASGLWDHQLDVVIGGIVIWAVLSLTIDMEVRHDEQIQRR